MIGLWHSVSKSPRVKFEFKIAKKDTFSLHVVMEPLPLPLKFTEVEVEGQHLRGIGEVFWSEEEELVAELNFEEEQFTGKLYIPKFGTYSLNGVKGRGPFFGMDILDALEPYRKSNVEQRTEKEINDAVNELLGKMSLDEKIGQMFQCQASNFSFGSDIASDPPEQLIKEGRVGSVLGAFDIARVFELQKLAVEKSPLGIPLLFHGDIIHGSQTIFPIPLAWSCSWEPQMIKEACEISAKEATASGIMYNHGPMIDISHDARWGRVAEGIGEDPYLGSVLAKAQVEGYQGNSLFNKETMVASAKHFIGYGAAEGGRDYNTVDISEGTLRNLYLPPFEAALKAGSASVMNAFNIFQGVPVAANTYILNELLRKELEFQGILISDYGSVDEIRVHGNAQDTKNAAKKAVNATMDIEMVTRSFEHLPQLVETGEISETQIDEAVRRILYLKYQTGIMDDPFRYIRPEKEAEYHFNDAHLQSSKKLAQKSIVLLKNNQVLPMVKDQGSIALIGPFADSKDLLGPWQFSRYSHMTPTLYESMLEKGISKEHLFYSQGSGVNEAIDGGIDAAVAKAKQADTVILALGESSSMSGEAASRMDVIVPEPQQRLAEAIVALGKPTILVLTNGRPLVLDWFEKHVDAIVETWFLGSQASHAITDVLMGDCNPSGKLTMSFPARIGQVPVYYNHFNTGRPLTSANQHEKFISKYLDGPNEPLYPFGYGLSYTTFAYSDLKLDKRQIHADEELSVSVKVTNTGETAGVETVQLYVQDCCGSVVRPVKELKGFQKVQLGPGESKEVIFQLSMDDLTFWSPNDGYTVEPGSFKVFVGSNSREVMEEMFELSTDTHITQ